MFSFLSKLLVRGDDQFLANIQDMAQRVRYVKRLYRVRYTSLGLAYVLFALALLASIFTKDGNLGVTFGLVGIVELTAYLNADMTIKMIRISELEL